MPKFLWNLYALCYDAITGLDPYQQMLDEVVAALEVNPGMRVLDAGCGTGALADRLAVACPDLEFVGVDLSPSMLARARARRAWPPSFTFVEGDIDAALSRDGRGFDRIASVNLIWTLPDPQQTLGLMVAGLREHGRMVHATPRFRVRAHAIVWQHLRQQRGWRLARALLQLPSLFVAGLINLLLVAASMLAARGPRARQRWHEEGLARLLREAGAGPVTTKPCYAGQGHLLVCGKQELGASGTRLPGPPERL
jgi:SAM-dependent methyltransferase